MTPAHIAALVGRKNFLEMRTDSRFGMIVATILNLFIKKGSKAVGPLQAMGYDEDEARSSGGEKPQSQLETLIRFRIAAAGAKRAEGKGV